MDVSSVDKFKNSIIGIALLGYIGYIKSENSLVHNKVSDLESKMYNHVSSKEKKLESLIVESQKEIAKLKESNAVLNKSFNDMNEKRRDTVKTLFNKIDENQRYIHTNHLEFYKKQSQE